MRIENRSVARARLEILDDEAVLQFAERFGRGNSLDLHPVCTRMGVARMEKALVPLGFVAEQEQSLGIGVEAADGVNAGRERKISERTVWRTVRSELR